MTAPSHILKPYQGLSCTFSLLKFSLLIGIVVYASSLSACAEQPKSMFEQQAEAESADKIAINTQGTPDISLSTTAAITTSEDSDKASPTMTITPQQVIAQQPNCDATQTECQYFELNTLSFSPEQPWLTSIMWQNIARVVAPKAPLASKDTIAKDTVLKLLKQIEYSTKFVNTLPLYQRIDTELIVNPTADNQPNTTDSHAVTPDISDNPDKVSTAYLVIHNRHDRHTAQQQSTYVMLDMQKKLQLTLTDILLPSISKDDLLLAIQAAQTKGLMLHAPQQHTLDKPIENWSPQLLQQWYLDAKGLLLVFHLDGQGVIHKATADIIMPYALLKGFIKPYYIVPALDAPKLVEPKLVEPKLVEPKTADVNDVQSESDGESHSNER